MTILVHYIYFSIIFFFANSQLGIYDDDAYTHKGSFIGSHSNKKINKKRIIKDFVNYIRRESYNIYVKWVLSFWICPFSFSILFEFWIFAHILLSTLNDSLIFQFQFFFYSFFSAFWIIEWKSECKPKHLSKNLAFYENILNLFVIKVQILVW